MKIKSKKYVSSQELMHKQLTTITVIFSIVATFFIGVGILIGVFSYKSVDQIVDARKELTDNKNELFKESSLFQEKINNKIDNKFYELENKIQKLQQNTNDKIDKKLESLENRFSKLSGETLKKPKIILLFNNRSLNGQKIMLRKINSKFAIPSISIENVGERELQLPSINIYFSEHINILRIYAPRREIDSYWEERDVVDNFYKSHFQFVQGGVTEDLTIISPKELDNLPTTIIEGLNKDVKEIDCVIKVFYSTELPEIARFKLVK